MCAEPLEWTGYGPCGHTDACDACVTRLRFVLGDRRCVICQQQCPAVVVTRFLGAYTQTLPPAAFEELPVRAGEPGPALPLCPYNCSSLALTDRLARRPSARPASCTTSRLLTPTATTRRNAPGSSKGLPRLAVCSALCSEPGGPLF